ncbi:MAG TPA: hypothetical protein VJ741_24270 [Solirubrobacteraceae bacterium]|nr:hypothetical protein [Solirubrobacteraceae bacterium]
MNAPSSGEAAPGALSYLDVIVIVVAAPIMLLIGAPAVGYLVGAAVWILLRAAGVAVDRAAAVTGDPRREVNLRLAYLLGRLFLLAIAVILVRNGSGRDAALTALLVIVFAFTMQLILSFTNRPRSR